MEGRERNKPQASEIMPELPPKERLLDGEGAVGVSHGGYSTLRMTEWHTGETAVLVDDVRSNVTGIPFDRVGKKAVSFNSLYSLAN